jgi:chromosome segregation ATPase
MARFEQHIPQDYGAPAEAVEQLRLLLNELQVSKAEIRKLESQCALLKGQADELRQERAGLVEQLRHWQQQASTWREASRKGEHQLQLTCLQLKAVAQERDDLLRARDVAAEAAPSTSAVHRMSPPKAKVAKRPRNDWAAALRTFFS